MTKYQLAQIRLLRKMVFDFTGYLKERNGQPINAIFIGDVEQNFQNTFKAIFELDNGMAEVQERKICRFPKFMRPFLRRYI